MELWARWAVPKASLQYTSANFLPFGRSSNTFKGNVYIFSKPSGFVSIPEALAVFLETNSHENSASPLRPKFGQRSSVSMSRNTALRDLSLLPDGRTEGSNFVLLSFDLVAWSAQDRNLNRCKLRLERIPKNWVSTTWKKSAQYK